MGVLQINDWEKWQSYRSDRGTPPWIKVHRCIFSNQKWVMLSDAEKGQLVSIWVLGADNNGKIPADATLVQKMCMLDSRPNLNKFIELHFLSADGCIDDAKATPKRRQVDSPETETETETEYSRAFLSFWNNYPNKKAKAGAYKVWRRLKVSNGMLSKILSGLENSKRSTDWTKENGRFIPHPATWLNNGRWEDEFDNNAGEGSKQLVPGAI